jgi:toxin ParE1/3/4
MSHFRLSPKAERDLDELADYIADRSPSAAVHEVEKLLDKFALLGRNPLLGEMRNDLSRNLRGFVAGSFLILYTPTANGIEVARVVHAARDLGSFLRQE